jgi:uncharacterized membrane protein (UPF0182 family)
VTPRRRLLVGIAIAALLLVSGRALSAVYADYTWYAAMTATPLWNERAGDILLIYGIGWVVAVLVAFVNLSAFGHSIGALTLPRRLANVEFGEAVPRKYLDRFALVLSIAIAAALTPALPQWTSLALARLPITFRETDPFFQHDLAFYTTWLPFEKALYLWMMLLVVGVAVPTPGAIGGFHVAYQVAVQTFFGAPADRASGAAIVLHAISFVPVSLLGIVFMAREGLTLHGAQELAKR